MSVIDASSYNWVCVGILVLAKAGNKSMLIYRVIGWQNISKSLI